MVVIIFPAELGAAQVLWGPCPRNDSALIKECLQHWDRVQQGNQSSVKTLQTQPLPQNEDLSEGWSGGKTQPPLKHRRTSKTL